MKLWFCVYYILKVGGYLFIRPTGGNQLAIYNLTIIGHLKIVAYTVKAGDEYLKNLRFLCMPFYFTEIYHFICSFLILVYFSSTNVAENLKVFLSR